MVLIGRGNWRTGPLPQPVHLTTSYKLFKLYECIRNKILLKEKSLDSFAVTCLFDVQIKNAGAINRFTWLSYKIWLKSRKDDEDVHFPHKH